MSHIRIAFLKGINVGGHRVTMDELRDALSPAGLSDVSTFIASGNVAFAADSRTSGELEAAIGESLANALGYGVETFVRQLPELSDIVSFTEGQIPGEGWKPHIMFGREETSTTARDALSALETPDDLFRFQAREVVWLRRGKMTDSTIKAHHLDRASEKRPVTVRTLRTVQRILGKYGA